MNDGMRFMVVFQALPSGIPGAVRLRRLLKLAGRVFGLKCIDIQEAPAEEPKGPERKGEWQ